MFCLFTIFVWYFCWPLTFGGLSVKLVGHRCSIDEATLVCSNHGPSGVRSGPRRWRALGTITDRIPTLAVHDRQSGWDQLKSIGQRYEGVYIFRNSSVVVF